jgi:parallel beta-helix repeat protein
MKNAVILISLTLTCCIINAQVYVATTGSDATGNGTPGNPYRTITYGINASLAGNTVFISSGTYFEIAELYINKPLSLVKNGTSPVIIDAVNRNGTQLGKYMIGIVNTNNVTINGISLQNCIGNGAKAIYIIGNGNNITISNCTITNIGWISNSITTLPPNSGTVANAIRVEGSSTIPLKNITLSNNDINNCATGWGEAVTITGNVDTFMIQRNAIHEIANIGIVAAGNYATGAPVALNQARNGLISLNEIYNCMSGIATSAGIYIDGAVNCTIERNKLYRNGAGISIGCEVILPDLANAVAGHIIRNNLVYNNAIAGIFIGSATAGNRIENSRFYNNTLYKNATGMPVNGITTIGGSPVEDIANGSAGDILLLNSDNITLQNNIIWPYPGRRAMVGMSGTIISNFTGDNNVYFRDDATPLFAFASISFNGIAGPQTYNNLADFTTATGLEAHSVFGNPGFINASLYNFMLATGALSIDKGNPVYNAAFSGNTDFAGYSRVYNNIRIDAGAYEYQGGIYTLLNYTFNGNGNWNIPGNWSSNTVPPSILTPGSQIIINPITGGQCMLNVSQTIMPGASLLVSANGKLKIPGKLTVQ